MESTLKKISNWSLLILSIIGLLIAITNFILPAINVDRFFDNGTATILVMLSLIGTAIVSQHFTINSSVKEIEAIIPSLSGAKVVKFKNAEAMELYLSDKLKKAEDEVLDLTWKKSTSSGFDTPKRVSSRKKYDLSIKHISSNVKYKEVFIFSHKSRIEKLKARIKENKAGYSCKYISEYCEIPRLQFVLIDNKEIVFASSQYKELIAIENKELGALLSSYFFMVWNRATYLKRGKEIYQEEYEKVLSKYDI